MLLEWALGSTQPAKAHSSSLTIKTEFYFEIKHRTLWLSVFYRSCIRKQEPENLTWSRVTPTWDHHSVQHSWELEQGSTINMDYIQWWPTWLENPNIFEMFKLFFLNFGLKLDDCDYWWSYLGWKENAGTPKMMDQPCPSPEPNPIWQMWGKLENKMDSNVVDSLLFV